MNNLRVARAAYALLLAFGYFNWMRIYLKLPQRIAGTSGTMERRMDGLPKMAFCGQRSSLWRFSRLLRWVYHVWLLPFPAIA